MRQRSVLHSGLRSMIVVLVTLLAAAPALAAAQTSPPPPAGITVVGVGRASSPADSANIRMYISDQSMMYGPPTAPEPGATPGVAEREAVEPVAAAIATTSVADEDIEIVVPPYLGNENYGPYGPTSAIITVTVASPDTESLRRIIDAATVGAAESGQIIGGIDILYTVTDCSQLIQDARQAAFDDATRKAETQAGIMGVTLGNPLAARDAPYGPDLSSSVLGGSPEGACSSSNESILYYGASGPTPFDITADPEVVIFSTLEVSFEAGLETLPGS